MCSPRRGDPFERVKGIEPSPPAWKAGALPLSYTRESSHCKGSVGLVGLEPTTSTSQTSRATKLRHSPSRHQGNSQPFLVTDDSYVVDMELEAAVLERVRTYDALSRWEKSELGRQLRRTGLSYGEIMELIEVKKSTLATWCRDVRLSEEQIEALKKRRPSTKRGIPRDTQRKRHREIELITAQAVLEAEHLIEDPFWVAGVCMYGERGRKPSGNSPWPMPIRRHCVCSSDGLPSTCPRKEVGGQS